MISCVRAALVGAVSILVCIGTSVSATAADDGSTGGGSVAPPPATAPETRQAAQKTQLAYAWAMSQGGQRAASLAVATPTDSASYTTLLRAYEAQYGTVDATSASRTVMAAAAATQYKTLSLTWYRQSTSYYCGPATGYMMLKFKSLTTSALDGSSLSQARLATSTYMSTDANGETSTWTNNMNYGLNKWRNGSTSGYYVRNLVDSASELKTTFTYSIGINEPIAVSTGETTGGAHYNSHPNRTIGHWIVGYGFYAYGDNIWLADPASGISGYTSSKQKFDYATSTFYSNFNAGRYNVW